MKAVVAAVILESVENCDFDSNVSSSFQSTNIRGHKARMRMFMMSKDEDLMVESISTNRVVR